MPLFWSNISSTVNPLPTVFAVQLGGLTVEGYIRALQKAGWVFDTGNPTVLPLLQGISVAEQPLNLNVLIIDNADYDEEQGPHSEILRKEVEEKAEAAGLQRCPPEAVLALALFMEASRATGEYHLLMEPVDAGGTNFVTFKVSVVDGFKRIDTRLAGGHARDLPGTLFVCARS